MRASFFCLSFSGLWRDATPWTFVERVAAVLIIVLLFRGFAAKPLLLRRASVMALPLFAAYLYGAPALPSEVPGGSWGRCRIPLGALGG